ncbi:MAG: hypothetical protein OXG24_08480 [Gammaproteobacteria bacterium]|nr:hypothetical protein [Gammaproteobacteria bacterium]
MKSVGISAKAQRYPPLSAALVARLVTPNGNPKVMQTSSLQRQAMATNAYRWFAQPHVEMSH